MNYRHAFHAGNFADVLKHLVLTRCILHLQQKEKAFRVLDTHAGPGLYDLSSDEAQRTGEWQSGIGAIAASWDGLPDAVQTIAAPWFEAVRSFNADDTVTHYPGSPALARRLLRPQDRLSAIELHPDDARRLKTLFAGDHQVRVIALDGWLALGGHLPPKEKRGLVLIDPPFEEAGEFDRMVDGTIGALKRWRGGTFLLWYPIKDHRAVEAFRRRLAEEIDTECLDVSIEIRARSPVGEARLDGTGIAVINPPYTLADDMKTVLPAFAKRLSEDGVARFSITPF